MNENSEQPTGADDDTTEIPAVTETVPNSRRIAAGVGLVAGILFTGALFALTALTSHLDAASCESISKVALGQSKDRPDAERVKKMLNETLVADHRDDFTIPSGNGMAVALECTATAAYADGNSGTVDVILYVDADENLSIVVLPAAEPESDGSSA